MPECLGPLYSSLFPNEGHCSYPKQRCPIVSIGIGVRVGHRASLSSLISSAIYNLQTKGQPSMRQESKLQRTKLPTSAADSKIWSLKKRQPLKTLVRWKIFKFIQLHGKNKVINYKVDKTNIFLYSAHLHNTDKVCRITVHFQWRSGPELWSSPLVLSQLSRAPMHHHHYFELSPYEYTWTTNNGSGNAAK